MAAACLWLVLLQFIAPALSAKGKRSPVLRVTSAARQPPPNFEENGEANGAKSYLMSDKFDTSRTQLGCQCPKLHEQLMSDR